jgi:serine/threonine-protein kinase
MKPERGQVIGGKYRLVEPLGAGGMGSVWRARHTELDADVALKVMASDLAGSLKAVERFKREARAAARLKSVHVVQIHDFGVEASHPYMVMELLGGEDLKQRLRRVGPMSLQRAFDMVRAICKALYAAHEIGIVHRDIKPANVFLARDAQDEVVKVLDFGIAKDHAALVGPETSGSSVLGSPLYMSPEQARAERVDHRSDLWSVAVVAFELLTGHNPFKGPTTADVFARICSNELPTPSTFGVVHPGLDGFFATAFQRDPSRRYSHALELVEALGAVVRASPSAHVAPSQDVRLVVRAHGDASSGPRGRDSDTLPLAATALEAAPAGSLPTATTRRRGPAIFGAVAATAVGVGISVLWHTSFRNSPSSTDSAAAHASTDASAAPAAPMPPSLPPSAQPTPAPQIDPVAASAAKPPPTASPPSAAHAGPAAARSVGTSDAGTRPARRAPTSAPTATPPAQVDPLFGVPVTTP